MKAFRYISIALLSVLLLFSCASTAETLDTAAAPAAMEQQGPVKPDAPKLDVEVTPEMEFFKDGYEIVTVNTLADGDTTTFNTKSGPRTTRYLAMDTPETSNGVEPWGMAAKRYVNDLLTNANEIIIERDPELFRDEAGVDNSTLDKYGRLLAHVWVDGELVQYKVIEESLANVNYLYYDYKYNDVLIKLESYVRAVDNRRVYNREDLDPEYDYSDNLYKVGIEELGPAWNGKRVEVTGIISGTIGANAYMQTPDGEHGIYIYNKGTRFRATRTVGNEATYIGRYTVYNGIPELGSPEVAPLLISEGNEVVCNEGSTAFLTEDNMGRLVTLRNCTVDSVSIGKALVSDADGDATVFVDKDTKLKGTDLFEAGKTYDITGNVSFHNDEYQLNVRYVEDVVEVQ